MWCGATVEDIVVLIVVVKSAERICTLDEDRKGSERHKPATMHEWMQTSVKRRLRGAKAAADLLSKASELVSAAACC